MPRVYMTVHEMDLDDLESKIAGALGAKHLRNKDVAEKIGKSESTISRMLKNIDSMKVGDLLRICEMTNRKVELVKRGQ